MDPRNARASAVIPSEDRSATLSPKPKHRDQTTRDDVLMNLAVIAAFTAAGLSLLNVAYSARLARRNQLDQWRRDTELPLIGAILTLSEDATTAWVSAAGRRSIWIQSLGLDGIGENVPVREEYYKFFHEGADLHDRMRLKAAQLQLVAGPPLLAVVATLLRTNETVQHVVRPASGADDFYELCNKHCGDIARIRESLVGAARQDLRIDRRPRHSFMRRTPPR